MPRFTIHHVTRYIYEAPVRDSANRIVLFPIRDEFQDVLKQDIIITGDPEVDLFKDYCDNEIGTFMNAEPHLELVIDSKVQVVTKCRPVAEDAEPADKQWAYLHTLKNQLPFIDFLGLEHTAHDIEVGDALKEMALEGLTPLATAARLTDFVFRNFAYNQDVTDAETTFDEAWKLKAGVCQDFAQVLLFLLRKSFIPSRYVSGYICPNKAGMRGEGATHAWVEVYIPGYGWLGLDPTNNIQANELHVRLAVGRNFSDCSPVKGTYKGISGHRLEVGVSVAYEDGRTTQEPRAVLTAQPAKTGSQQNSYQRYLEMQQQQQQ